MTRKNNAASTASKKMCKIEYEARSIVGKLRRGASLTVKDKLRCIGNIGRCMQRYGLNSIRHMKPAHVARYFAELKTASGTSLSAGRMANHATAMRTLCRAIGKPDIVPSSSQLGCARNIANRTKHADERVNLSKMQDVAAKLSENNRLAYSMALLFGLRQKESVLSWKTVTSDGVEKLVVEGAKGNRPREILIENEQQRAALKANQEYRASHEGKLIDEGKSLKQGIKQLQNELSSAGATRISGANMHTLRREWIIERCEKILAAPEDARDKMIEELVFETGHGRLEVIACYTAMLSGN